MPTTTISPPMNSINLPKKCRYNINIHLFLEVLLEFDISGYNTLYKYFIIFNISNISSVKFMLKAII